MKKILALILLFPSMCFAQIELDWSEQLIVNDDISLGFTRPKVVFTTNDVPVIMWSKKTNREVYVSRWNGTSFGTPTKVTPDGLNAFAQDWAAPDMAAFGNKVVVAFAAVPEQTGLIYTVTSLDGGLTFSDTVRVSDDPVTRFPAVTVAPDLSVSVAFMEFEPGYLEPHYAVSTSPDGLQPYSGSVKATGPAPGEACDCCPANIITNGNKYVLFFRNNDNNLRDIWASVSTDNGQTFPTVQEIDTTNWMIGACPSSGPSGFMTDDSLYYTWMSGATGNTRVMVASASASDLSIGQHYMMTSNLASNASQNFPIIAGYRNNMGIAWEQIQSGVSNIMFAVSDAGIPNQSRDSIYLVNTDANSFAKNPHVAFSNGVYHITWQDMRSTSINYRSASIKNFVGIEDINLAKNRIAVYPNPSSGQIQLDNLIGVIAINVYNLAGQLVFERELSTEQQVEIDLSALPKGTYILEAVGDDFNEKQTIITN